MLYYLVARCKSNSVDNIILNRLVKMFVVKFLLISCSLATVLGGIPFESRASRVSDAVYRDDGIQYRLPNHTHPVKYYIGLSTRVDLGELDFRGVVNIDVVVDEPTRHIVLHARQLTISNVTLSKYTVNGKALVPVMILPYTYDVVTDFLTIPTNHTDLNVGDRLLLSIEYLGTLATGGHGFYRSFYSTSTGDKRYHPSNSISCANELNANWCFVKGGWLQRISSHQRLAAHFPVTMNRH